MPNFRQQLSLLLWKNFILRRRHKLRLIMEFLWPLFLFLILMWVRTRGLKENKAACHLVEKAMPSVDGFEFIQSYICTLNNTCHSDVVEHKSKDILKDAMFPKFVRDANVVLRRISGSPDAIAAVNQTYTMLMNTLLYLGGIRSKRELENTEKIKLKDLMTKEGKENFLSNTPTYTSLSRTDLEEFLESDLYPNKLTRENFDELLTDFTSGKCKNSSEYEIIKVKEELFRKLCSMEQPSTFLLIFATSNYVSRAGMSKSISNVLAMDRAKLPMPTGLSGNRAVMNDFMKLAEIFSSFTNEVAAVMEGKDSPAANAALIYRGFCGVPFSTNTTTFGFDNQATNRFDTLRDHLKDFRTNHNYVYDPEVSETCNVIFAQLQSQTFTNLLWKQVKPFIRGKIYYAPDTNFTRDIMKRVDAQFQKLQSIEDNIRSGIDIIHRFRLWLREYNVTLAEVQNLVTDPVIGGETMALLQTVLGVSLNQTDKEQIEKVMDSLKKLNLTEIEETLSKLDSKSETQAVVLDCIRYNKSVPYETEYEAVEDGMKLLEDDLLWAVVIFEDIPEDGSAPKHLKYKIRMDSDKVDGTRLTRDRLTSKSPRRRPTFDMKYITNGFAYLQEMVEHSFISITNGESSFTPSTVLQQFPYPCYIYDQFIRAISRTFPLFMVLSWVYASAMIVKSIVLEKELRLKEVMKVMGLSNGVIWCGWFIDSFIIMTVSTVVLSVILKYGKIIEHSDFFLILVFMMSFTVATICLSFLVSTLFTRANSAAAAGGILFFITYLPYNFMLIWEERLTWYHLLASSLISNVAFGFGCTYLARLEEDGIGAQWDRISLRTLPDDDFNLIYCILMLLFDSVLYLALTLYIEAVFPGDSGMPKKWYFFCQKSYWRSGSNVKSKSYKSVPSDTLGDEAIPVIEAEPVGLKCGVAVSNLSKTYSNGRIALCDLNISFYEGQIASFLGHNGAGKTTTISILTGLFPPTSGSAKIYGRDIRTQMDYIRKDLGICPQYNVLFDRLTVEEHMIFYAGLKGKENVKTEIAQMLDDLGIPEKRKEFPKNLSGGMKRKLSVAIAFVGGSKTVFLDEPTSGVDPYSRRSIWELLLKYKTGRTIILTTHFMDEADILGDRIAIISQGRLKACGSSLFLKSQFGQGYSLRLVREESTPQETEEIMLLNNINPSESLNKENISLQRSIMTARHTDLLRSFVQHRIPEAIVVDDVGSEVVFLLPYKTTNIFPTLFNELDSNLQNLRISSYGISDTTLEDVFLRITVEDLEKTSSRKLNMGCCCFNMKIVSRLLKIKRAEKNCIGDVPNNHPPAVITASGDTTVRTSFTAFTQQEQNGTQHPLEPSRYPSQPSLVRPVEQEETLVVPTGNSNTSLSRMEDQLNEDNDEYTIHETSTTTATNAFDPNIDAEAGEVDGLLEHDAIRLADSDLFVKETEGKLLLIQYWEIILKRLRNSSRNVKAIFFEMILPAAFIALTLAFTLILPTPMDEASREITPWTYPSPNYIFFSQPEFLEPSNLSMQFQGTVDELTSAIGLGTPCLKDNLDKNICHPETWSMNAVEEFNRSRYSYVPEPLGDCSCDLGSQQCDEVVDKTPPPSFETPTDDFLLDVSKFLQPKLSIWLRDTFKEYDTSRYGGYQMLLRVPENTSVTEFLDLMTSLLDGTQYTPTIPPIRIDSKTFYKVWYENRGWVSSVAYLNGLHNLILRQNLPPALASEKDEYGITLFNHPLNLTKIQQEKESLKTAALGVVHAICIIFALSFVPASFTVYLIEERKSGGKHLHLVSGVKPITYWFSNFTFDMGKYCVTVALCVLLFYAFDARAYIAEESVGAFIILLILYGWASIPLMYPASYLFGIPSTAFVILACTNLFVGVITTVSTFVLEQLGDKELEEIGDVLKQVFLVFPHYCLGRGLIELVRLHIEATAFGRILNAEDPLTSRFKWELLGKLMVCLAVQGFLFFLVNLCFEYRQWLRWLFCSCNSKCHKGPSAEDYGEDDIDVKREADRVLNQPSPTAALKAENLTKIYHGKQFPAVNRLSFEIEKGECFGLLGVNGAGKTSTFKMLTGDVKVSSGRANVMGYDVEKDLDHARQHFGYCPQEDGLDPLLNAYEQLELYGRLRGMKRADVKKASVKLIHSFGLKRYSDKRCGTYSGGNKRKVSAAIALIGNPDVIFLDEPTSGMDPGARRQLWRVVLKMIHLGKSVVLTTHSMEECEALCTRLAIMVNGKFTCLGSLQHLKNRFGSGYTLTVRCEPIKQDEFLKNMATDLPTAKLEDHHCSQMKFSILQQDVKLSDIFNVMFMAKASEIVEDYSVSQTTLDDIFVKFASHQRDERDRKPVIVVEVSKL